MSDNYGDLSETYANFENSKIVILPVPFESDSKETKHGPKAIMEASQNMDLYDIETDSEVYLQGIYTYPPVNHQCSQRLFKQLYSDILSLLNYNKFVVCIGGEHTISLGPVQAHALYYENIGVLQLDAHANLYPASYNNTLSIMTKIQEHANVQSITSVGINSISLEEKKNLNKVHLFFAQNLQNDDLWIDQVLKTLPEKVYITVDLDVLAPSVLSRPGCGKMQLYTLLKLLKKVAYSKTIIGLDVVELRPIKDDLSSAHLAAKLIYKILSYIFEPCRRKQ